MMRARASHQHSITLPSNLPNSRMQPNDESSGRPFLAAIVIAALSLSSDSGSARLSAFSSAMASSAALRPSLVHCYAPRTHSKLTL